MNSYQGGCFMQWSKPCLKMFLFVFLLFAMLAAGRADAGTAARPGDRVTVNGTAAPGDWAAYTFDKPARLRRIRLVFDSDLNRPKPTMPCVYPLLQAVHAVPPTLAKGFHVDVVRKDGAWKTVFTEKSNIQRLRQIPLDVLAHACRCVVDTTWGNDKVLLFAFDVND